VKARLTSKAAISGSCQIEAGLMNAEGLLLTEPKSSGCSSKKLVAGNLWISAMTQRQNRIIALLLATFSNFAASNQGIPHGCTKVLKGLGPHLLAQGALDQLAQGGDSSTATNSLLRILSNNLL